MSKRNPEPSHCVFSVEEPTPLYRYSLEHRWDDETPSYARKTVVWILLNPSTADESSLDPTLRRCKGFSKGLGAGGMVILNAFAWRSTDPKGMLSAPDPIGPLNDSTIDKTIQRSDVIAVIAGWGCHGKHMDRDKQIIDMAAGKLQTLRINKDGTCAHPLYLPASSVLVPFGIAAPIVIDSKV